MSQEKQRNEADNIEELTYDQAMAEVEQILRN